MVVSGLGIDLGLAHKESKAVTTKQAAMWTAIWATMALVFNALVWWTKGPAPALEFLTGYLIEFSLSVDNIFVFIMLFSYFVVAPAYRHRVLFWGIIGALVMRAAMIGVGTALITRFHWVMYIFGAFLLFTGVKMGISKEDGEPDPDKNPIVGAFKKLFPTTSEYHGESFFVKEAGSTAWKATPLFIVLLVVETTDVMFALDSIPAIFAITKDPFIVFTSNVFAILGLRSLYFLLDGIMGLFRFLKIGLAVVLSFIGVKMLIAEWYHIEIMVSLGVVFGVLAVSILASILIPAKDGEGHKSH
ncbi:MAG: Integral rane protein TerC [Symbiobacteriaceae bacterium]|jgi:tellurite resistance protein TerC|nr:Integral rane protein TerC [Symbiobacteriaceae bacterium]